MIWRRKCKVSFGGYSLFIRLVAVKNMMFTSKSWLVKSKSHMSLQFWGWGLASGRCNINFVIRKNYLFIGCAQVTCCFQYGFTVVPYESSTICHIACIIGISPDTRNSSKVKIKWSGKLLTRHANDHG